MVSHNEALTEYVKIIQRIHGNNLLYLDKILALPSVKCTSYKLTTESDNTLLNVYRLNGFMLTRFITFYQEFVLELEKLAKNYCRKHKLNYEIYKNDIDELNKIAEDNLNTIHLKLETEDQMTDDIVVIASNIKETYACIDHFVNLELRNSRDINIKRVDVVGKKMFSLFRRNELYTMTSILGMEFPKSGNLTLKKRYFIDKLNELDDLIALKNKNT
jgi:glycerophosphoryl diester phosphodiesterase